VAQIASECCSNPTPRLRTCTHAANKTPHGEKGDDEVPFSGRGGKIAGARLRLNLRLVAVEKVALDGELRLVDDACVVSKL
jgi:hypothetical protein